MVLSSQSPQDQQDTPARGLDRTIVWASVLISLVLVNLIGLSVFGRLDLTRDREFTLSRASKRALSKLREPVTVRAYFSRDLPPPHGSQARYVKDLLDSFYTQSRGKLRFEFIDPASVKNDEEADRKRELKRDVFGNTVREPTRLERELEGLGIPPVQVRVNEADKVEVKRAYMGLAFSYQGKREVIPVVTATDGLEYDITSMLRRLAREQPQTLAIVEGHGGTNVDQEMQQGMSALREHFELGRVNLAEANTLLPDAAAMLIVGPETPFSEAEQQTIDAYVHAGHPVGFFLPPVHAALQGLTATANDHGLAPLLERYGVKMPEGLVADARCATISVQQQQGYMRVNQPVRYPLIGQAESLESSPVTQGLAGVLLPFMGALEVTAPADGPVRAQVWARSSAKAWRMAAPANLDPMQKWQPEPGQLAPQDLLVALSGPMGRIGKGKAASTDGAAEARVLVAAGDGLWLDSFLGQANKALLLNAVDWLVGDDDLLAVRSRGMSSAPLADVGEARRRTIKYGNVVGLPVLLIGFGLVRWRARQERRRSVFV